MQDYSHCRLKNTNLSFEKRVPWAHSQEETPRIVVTPDLFHSVQQYRYSEGTAAMFQEGLAIASTHSRPWHHPHDAGFTGKWNIRVGSGWPPFRYPKKLSKARQGVFERLIREFVEQNSKVQWRPPEFRNIEYLPRKGAGCKWSQSEKKTQEVRTGKAIWRGPPKTFGTHILPPCVLDTKYGFTEFNLLLFVCLFVFQLSFGLLGSNSISLLLHLEMGICILCL